MVDVQMLFPTEPKEFWQKLKTIVEQVVIEHNNTVPLLTTLDKNGTTTGWTRENFLLLKSNPGVSFAGKTIIKNQK